MSTQTNNGTPPTGNDWGERTQQAQELRCGTAPAHWETDAYEIGQKFGIEPFDVEDYLESSKYARMCYPDAIIHERDPTLTKSTKGTDVLFKGDRDSGKTTKALWLSKRLMERGERVLWRGRYDGSGWLAYKHWATVWLPSNADVDATWMEEGEGAELSDVDDLESIVRSVRYYDDVYDLLDQLGETPQGTFNVLYPDPSFSGCEEATEGLENVAGKLPFVPEWEADERDATPLIHWWFGFWFARKEHGPYVWMSLIFDEVGDWLEEGATQETSRLYDKIKSLRKVWAASRKRLMSMYFFAHKEKNVHWMVREEFKWRVHMPDGSPNPRLEVRSSLPQGFDKVKMHTDMMSDMKVGVGLIYTQNEFALFRWDDIPQDQEDERRWLSVKLTAPEGAFEDDDVQEETNQQLEFDEDLFTHWENATQERLIVNDPGSGYVDVVNAELSEGAESPISGLEFADVDEDGQVAEVLMENAETGEKIVVARLPTASSKPGVGSRSEVGA